jgi:hypothetical protein
MKAKHLKCIMEEFPTLTFFGFGVWTGTPPEERAAEFAVNRRALVRATERFEAARVWIRVHMVRRHSINRRRGSYGLKHVCERDIGYISNGVFIAAMIAEGFRFEQFGPNAWFNAELRRCSDHQAVMETRAIEGLCGVAAYG